MQRQLRLIQEEPRNERPDDWHLDEHVKDVGRRGLADARKALAEAHRRTAA
jgi:hypothetical protein